ncbi:hypothetical protein [Effusibacillus lacus]|uniref:Peptidylprolyl isomerase n=1 Tax=Effusibacillus lacus TaxID=1348429 RepID=A0A292YN71_9BACL|nr:hypothetical protein [Effusibacillus lacus]TCS72062.1 hypothetical protein EDD64_12357 [Effusibacillus lacus]GAX90349.1 peptidylprolyl isomerase [Effusibacillus lacus]
MEVNWLTSIFQILVFLVFPAFVFFLIVGISKFLQRISTNTNRIQVIIIDNDVWIVDPSKQRISVYRLNKETNKIEEIATKNL